MTTYDQWKARDPHLEWIEEEPMDDPNDNMSQHWNEPEKESNEAWLSHVFFELVAYLNAHPDRERGRDAEIHDAFAFLLAKTDMRRLQISSVLGRLAPKARPQDLLVTPDTPAEVPRNRGQSSAERKTDDTTHGPSQGPPVGGVGRGAPQPSSETGAPADPLAAAWERLSRTVPITVHLFDAHPHKKGPCRVCGKLKPIHDIAPALAELRRAVEAERESYRAAAVRHCDYLESRRVELRDEADRLRAVNAELVGACEALADNFGDVIHPNDVGRDDLVTVSRNDMTSLCEALAAAKKESR